MCGIAGIYKLKSEIRLQGRIPKSEESIQKNIKMMTDSIIHRGPDDEGFYIDKRIALGHRRLAILDLSPLGHQPMLFKDLVIVFNGEIYNYLELSQELELLGHKFKSKCDTEVILHAYEEWGTECLDRFAGMWALAIYNQKTQELFCALDRWGIKPFYYYQDERQLIFASEIKAIFQNADVLRQANYSAIYDFLVFNRTDHNTYTCFKNIKRLLPGHFITINRQGKIQTKRWYEIKYRDTESIVEQDDLKLKKLIEESVKLRLRSDVPVGSCLSGGLDSSTIVALIKKENPKAKLKTFSAVFPKDWAQDESQYINLVNRRYHLENYQIQPTYQELLKDINQLIYHQEEPFGSASIFASWEVMKLAHQHKIKVLLDGQGGDEILAGYPYMAGLYFYELLKKGKIFTLIKEIFLFYKNQKFDFASAINIFLYKLAPNFIKKRIVEAKCDWLAKDSIIHQSQSNFAEDFFAANSLNEFLAKHMEHKLAHLLRFEDKNAMAFSIENREVYLDHHLVEFALNLSASAKIKNGVTKAILREAMKNILPAKILNRHDKIGFTAPQDLWFKEEKMLDYTKKFILSEQFKNRNIFDQDKVKKIISEQENGRRNHHEIIWKMLCLELWFRIFIDPKIFKGEYEFQK